MSRQWYYSKQSQRFGPISDEQFQSLAKSGQLQPTDLVWAKGMANWIPANKIKGLTFAAIPQDAPPPIPESSDETQEEAATSVSQSPASDESPLGFLDTLQKTSADTGRLIAKNVTAFAQSNAVKRTKSQFQNTKRSLGAKGNQALRKAGGIIALIGGSFSFFAAFFTLFVGGVGHRLGAANSGTVIGLGWGGVLFSLAAIVLGVIALVATTKFPGYLLIGCAILGMFLGGGFVAIFMVLVLLGGILAAVGGQS